MIPDKIYLPWEYSEIDVLPPGVTTKQVFGKDICFIRKDVLLEWAKEIRDKWSEPPASTADEGAIWVLDKLIDKLNSL